ncbi:TPA: hypothetical protein H1009_03625 [archaeon]|nr:hypothetical protein [Candidatus Naiadarchaeales archaeon SRR2090153.bin461]
MTSKEAISKEIKEIVIARLKTLDRDSKILLLGFDDPLTVRDLVNEIEKGTPLGRKIVEVQFKFIQMLAGGEI